MRTLVGRLDDVAQNLAWKKTVEGILFSTCFDSFGILQCTHWLSSRLRIKYRSTARLASRREAIEGFLVDEHEYHMGLLRHRGAEKQAYQCFRKLLFELQHLTAMPVD